MRHTPYLSLLLIFNLFLITFPLPSNSQPSPLRITRVTPNANDVLPGREIVIRFNRPVVPLGRMERKASEIPIKITPPLKCQWRWLDRSNLSCQLGEKDALKEATQYKMVIQPGIKAEDGATIVKPYVHTFITRRPKVDWAYIETWTAPGLPRIRVTFNQPVSRKSISNSLFMSFGKKPKKTVSLQAERDTREHKNPRYVWVPGENFFMDFGEQKPLKPDEQPKKYKEDVARRVWIIYPTTELPLNTKTYLNIKPGLISALGPEKGIEHRKIKEYHTFPPFRLMGIECRDNEGKKIFFSPKKDLPKGKLCNPMDYVSLSFSSPVIKEEAKLLSFEPDLAGGRKDFDPWDDVYSYSQLTYGYRPGKSFGLTLPQYLKAAQKYSIKGSLKDEFGRELPEPIEIQFATDHRKPEFKLTHRQSVLEKHEKNDLPLYITNLDKILLNYSTVTSQQSLDDLSKTLEPSKTQDVAFAIPLEVRKMLKGSSGIVYGKLESEPPIKKHEEEHYFLSQVTPYQVLVKLGHFNSLAWITDMKTGEPVQDANVSINIASYRKLTSMTEIFTAVKTDKNGIAILKGRETLDPNLEYKKYWLQDQEDRFVVKITKDNDLALLPLDPNFEINTYRVSGSFWETNVRKHGHIHAWGTTAQGIHRAGDKIQFKIFVRSQDNNTLVPAPQESYTLQVNDPMAKIVHEVKDFKLSEFGAYDGEFTTAKNAAVGWYHFNLKANFSKHVSWTPLRVLVTDFTPSPFKVENSLNGDLFREGDEIEVSTFAKLHSGGPYTDASTRITASFNRKTFSSNNRVVKGFWFDTEIGRARKNFHQEAGVLNHQGTFVNKIQLSNLGIIYGKIMVESAVQDDRGKYIANASSADYRGVDRFVGLKNTKWVYKQGSSSSVQYIVADEKGNPARGTEVNILIQRKHTKASRVKGSGNAFLTKYITEWVDAGTCKGISEEGASNCKFVPAHPGTYKFIAEIKDTKNRTHKTELEAWIVGKGAVVWSSPNNNSLEIIPEKNEYHMGETARYLVKNPFPGALALITIERYGVIKKWVQKLKGSTPVVEIPIENHYMPGVFLSITVVSPRVEKNPGTGELDLGKPTFRMGYIKVPVKDPFKELFVTSKTDKKIYKPRDNVKVSLKASPRYWGLKGLWKRFFGKKEPIELAVAVVNEAVFDLIQGGKSYYDPYKGFYTLDGLDIQNYSLLLKLIGRQKFEKKGANAGGGGGGDSPSVTMRTLFKFLAYWNPSLKTDKNGKAHFEFSLPDNLTGWRILTMAVTPSDRMGLGDKNFTVNRPTEIRPVMPNQVTEGDLFNAGFSVMNRTDKPRSMNVSIRVKGDVKGTEEEKTLSKTVQLQAYKRTTIQMPVQTKSIEKSRQVEMGELVFEVTAGDAFDQDGFVHKVSVHKRRSFLTAAQYGTTVEKKVEETVQFPKNIHTDFGSVSVTASPTVIGNVEGAFTYMKNYPYSCWEQKLSKGVMAAHFINLKKYLSKDLEWKEAEELPQAILDESANFQAPNGGISYFIPDDRYVSPYLSAYTALAFNWLRGSGYKIPSTVESKLHSYLLSLLRRNIVPSFYSKGMASTVRAVSLAALAGHQKITLSDLKRYEPHVDQMSLFGKAHYLQAALSLKSASKIVGSVTNKILGYSSQTAGKFMFNEQLDDSYTRILATPLRTNCAILSTFSKLSVKKSSKDIIGDVPFKMVRAITQTRGNRDHFENTQENLFCLNALVDYSKVFEKTEPNFIVKALMDNKPFGKANFKSFQDKMSVFEKPITEKDPGRKATVQITKEGKGRLYYATRIQYAPLDKFSKRTNAGIDIRKEYSVQREGKWVLLSADSKIKRGELIRVDIYLSIPTSRNFVVVDDPIPGGLEPVNRDLKTASTIDAQAGEFEAAGSSWYFKFSDWHHFSASRWSFYHQELRHDSAKFYSEYLQPGNYLLSYTAQAIATGTFVKMPIHAEEMYDPDVFGKGVSSTLIVNE